jgi:DNA mismatch repair protein MutS2
LPSTSWDRSYFERGLFLEDLVEGPLAIRVEGRDYRASAPYLLRVLCEPPRSLDAVTFRRRILEELASSSELRRELEAAYLELVQLRALFCAGRHGSQALRRLEILRSIHKLFALLADSFADATSGLGRIREFGRATVEGQPYGRLGALLDHEEHLGTLDLRVRVGSDGELRTFQIVGVRENAQNPYHASPIARWVSKLLLMLRGYRMSGPEVLERLFDDVFSGLERSVALLFQLLGDVEVLLASLSMRDRAAAKGLAACLPELVDAPADGRGASPPTSIRGLFNPLLLAERTPPVPCDLKTEHGGSVVLVTGPNSGGKTRLLQAIALAQLLDL